MTEQAVYETDTERGRRELEAASRRKRERELGDMRKLLSIPEGRRFLWRLLSDAKVFAASYAGEAPSTFFNEGKRDIGIKVLQEILAAKPDAFSQMQREAAAEPRPQEGKS